MITAAIFCCRLKSNLFSLSYPAFWLFSHLPTQWLVILDTIIITFNILTFSSVHSVQWLFITQLSLATMEGACHQPATLCFNHDEWMSEFPLLWHRVLKLPSHVCNTVTMKPHCNDIKLTRSISLVNGKGRIPPPHSSKIKINWPIFLKLNF